MQQLILPLDLPPTFETKDFIVSQANEEAYLWLMRWPNWPTRFLAIYGDEGCGKTHLSHLWQRKTNARRLNAIDFNDIPLESLLQDPSFFILDEAHFIEKGEALFHFYNHVIHSKGGALLLSRTPPAHWIVELPDLKSRLNAIPAIKIHAPDEFLLAEVLQKLFTDLQIKVEATVISFLLKHIERSFESAHRWANLLNTYAFIQKRNITISLVRELLLKQEPAETHP